MPAAQHAAMLRPAALQELAATCKAKKLKGFEAIKGVHLVEEHFT